MYLMLYKANHQTASGHVLKGPNWSHSSLYVKPQRHAKKNRQKLKENTETSSNDIRSRTQNFEGKKLTLQHSTTLVDFKDHIRSRKRRGEGTVHLFLGNGHELHVGTEGEARDGGGHRGGAANEGIL